MNNTHIESAVAQLRQDDEARADVIELLAAVADREKRTPDPTELEQAARFVIDYIIQVPYLFKLAAVAAKHARLREPMEKILDTLRRYWQHDDDIIPDHMGSIGLLDDAYCSHCAMQAISDQYRMLSGKYLFPFDMQHANRSIRKILGAPYAADLDRYVMETLNAAGIIPALRKMADGQKRLDLDAAKTLWHHGRADKVSESALIAIVGNSY